MSSRLPFALFAAVAALPAQIVVSVLDYGALNNGTNATATTTAFTNAFNAAGANGKVRVPPGTYLINNGSGPFSRTGFNGEFLFEGNAALVFTNNANGGLAFTNGNGTRVTGLRARYQTAPSVRTTGEAIAFIGGTDVFVNDAVVENGPASGLFFREVTRPKVQGAVVANTLADGVHFANCEDAQISSLSATNTGDDGLAFINTTTQADKKGGTAANIAVRGSKARGIAIAGQSDVVVSGFLIDGTSSSGIFVATDTAFSTRVPDRVRIGNGVVRNAGTVTPFLGNRFGIEIDGAAGCSVSNVDVYGSASRGFSASSSTRVSASGVRVVSNASDDGFNVIGVGQFEGSNLVADTVPGYGFFFGTNTAVNVSGLSAQNVSLTNGLNRAVWFENNTHVTASSLHVVSTQATPRGYIVGSFHSGAAQRGTVNGIIGRVVNGALQLQNNSTPGLVFANTFSN